MKYAVLHKVNFREQVKPSWAALLAIPAYKQFEQPFMHVANIECNDKGQAFELSNHIDDDWTKNPGVTMSEFALHGPGARSTSVGDVLIDEEGGLWAVEPVGFQEAFYNPELKSRLLHVLFGKS